MFWTTIGNFESILVLEDILDRHGAPLKYLDVGRCVGLPWGTLKVS